MNDENILIMGDDGTGEAAANLTPSAPEKTLGAEASRPGDRNDALSERFLQQHQHEFHEFERRELEKLAGAERFRALTTEIASRRQWLAGLQRDVADCQNLDLGADLYKNMRLNGRPLLDVAQSPLFAAAALIQAHGQKVVHLAEQDLVELQDKLEALKVEKGEMLRELGPGQAGAQRVSA